MLYDQPTVCTSTFELVDWIYPSQFNITQNAAVNILDDAPSMIRKMRDKGWHTAIVGKTHWPSHQESGYDLEQHRFTYSTWI